MPIKINCTGWPAVIGRLLPASSDPRPLLNPNVSSKSFTEAVGAIKVNGVFKTTKLLRYPKTVELLSEIEFPTPPVILEVGASDGSASLAIMKTVQFSIYYLTDRYMEIFAESSREGVYFFDSEQNPILYANNWMVAYNDSQGALWPFGSISKGIFRAVYSASAKRRKRINLVNPDVLAVRPEAVRVEQFSVLEQWLGDKADLVIAANLLQQGYFSKSAIETALRNLRNAMRNFGKLIIIDNRKSEQSNVFRLESGRFICEAQIGDGCDIKRIVEGLA